MNTALIDTNILIYCYDISDIKKNKIAVDLLQRCFLKKETFTLSLQNLSEFYVNITKKVRKPLDAITAYFVVRDLIDFSNLKILNFGEKTILSAMEISKKFGISYWDSLIAATMTEHDISTIYTENIKDFKVPWIKAINPFKYDFRRDSENQN